MLTPLILLVKAYVSARYPKHVVPRLVFGDSRRAEFPKLRALSNTAPGG